MAAAVPSLRALAEGAVQRNIGVAVKHANTFVHGVLPLPAAGDPAGRWRLFFEAAADAPPAAEEREGMSRRAAVPMHVLQLPAGADADADVAALVAAAGGGTGGTGGALALQPAAFMLSSAAAPASIHGLMLRVDALAPSKQDPLVAHLHSLLVFPAGSAGGALPSAARGVGMLAMCLPVAHEGGGLAISSDAAAGSEGALEPVTVAWPAAAARGEASWIAFGSVTTCRVLPVASGACVVLMYALQTARAAPRPAAMPPLSTQHLGVLRRAVEAAGFMPSGGVLAFPCQTEYPHTQKSWIKWASSGKHGCPLAALLKGGDAVLAAACAELGLKVELVQYVGWPEKEWDFHKDYARYEGSGCHCVTLWLHDEYECCDYSSSDEEPDPVQAANAKELKFSPLVAAIKAGRQGGWFTRRLEEAKEVYSIQEADFDYDYDDDSWFQGSAVVPALERFGARFEEDTLLMGGRAAFEAALKKNFVKARVQVDYDGEQEPPVEVAVRCAAALRVTLGPYPDRCAPAAAAPAAPAAAV